MRRSLLRGALDHIVIVNVQHGRERAFRGRLSNVSADELVLSEVTLIDPQQADLGGNVVVPMSNVAWVQVM